MRAYVRFGLPDGSSVELGHGDLIGRLWSAALSLADPRISEAHAMVSLRGQDLLLLPLRGRFMVDGARVTSLVLAPGQEVLLAEGLSLRVEEVSLPTAVFAIEGDDLPRVALSGVCSLLTRPRPELVPRLVPEAPAQLWGDGEGWRLRIGDQSRSIAVGDTFSVDGRSFRAVGMSLDNARGTHTRLDPVAARRLHVVAQFDSVHLHADGGASLAISGLAARLVSELVAFDGPVAWEVLARELWPDEDDVHLLRHKLDVTLSRLRSRLREGEIRPDLIRSDGFGKIELFLHPGDTTLDRT